MAWHDRATPDMFFTGKGGVGKTSLACATAVKLAADTRIEEESLGHCRRVRDEIRAFVETLPGSLNGNMTS